MGNIAKKILIVEDDDSLVATYKTEFELSGFTTARAADGQAGLKMAKSEKPDLILLDIMMPKMGGIEALEHLKADTATRSIPVIVLTNFGSDESIKRAFDMGAVDFILKYRYTPGEVIEKVKAVWKGQF